MKEQHTHSSSCISFPFYIKEINFLHQDQDVLLNARLIGTRAPKGEV